MVRFNDFLRFMKKLSILTVCILISLFGCKTIPASMDGSSYIVDNTFKTEVINDSFFSVTIDGKSLKSGEKTQHSFPLNDSDLYDGWGVDYTIPLSREVFYLHKDKVQITNNQKIVVIETPIKNNIREAYIVVKNTSKQSMQLTNGMGTIFACCLEGRVNTRNAKFELNIAPSKVAIYEISKSNEEIKKERVYVWQDKVNYSLLQNTSLRNGYVYTFEFNGKEVIKVDERPLLKVGEMPWKNEDASLIIEKVFVRENFAYSMGRKKTSDADGNYYYCPYLSCLDSSTGAIRWEKMEATTEGSIYDGVILSNGNILSVGQSITKDNNVGAMWLYSPYGVLLNSKNCSEYLGFSAISSNNIVVGFDEKGISIAKISFGQNILQYKSLPLQLSQKDSITSAIPFYNQNSKNQLLFCNFLNEEGESLPSKLYELKEDGNVKEISLQDKISSIASIVQTSSGHVYVGGETARNEKSEAIILKMDGENLDVLYQGEKSFSYISSLQLSEETKELIATGVCKAKESSGLGGVPFIVSLDLASGKKAWRQEYKGMKYQVLRSIFPCLDYGFVASFSSILPNGEDYGSSVLLRLTASGKTILEK